MKILLINGKQALIDINQYFPFTYKISDLEEINIINFPSTKSVMLPRNTQNDELFGHIAEITRINFGYEDNKSGVSFNQFKKANYTLMYFSEVVSEGLLRIVNITDTHYEVELYDQAIELLEDLEDRELNELFIYNPNAQAPLNVRVNHEVIADMLVKDYGIKPIFGNYDSNHTSNQIYGLKTGAYGNTPAILELPSELTPLQLKTFPAGDMPYAMRLDEAFDMVERGSDVIFTPDVRVYTEHIHMLLNKPKNPLLTNDETLKNESYYRESSGDTPTGRFTEQYFVPIKNTNGTNKVFRNGNYVFNNEFEFIFKTNEPRSSGIWTQYLGTNWRDDSGDGSSIGVMHLTSDIYLTVDGVETLITSTKTKIAMIKGVNTTFRQVGDKEELKISGTYVLNSNIYPRSINGGTIRVRNKFENFSMKSNGVFVVTYPFNLKSGFSFTSNITPKIVYKPLDFSEYDLITSEKLLPKISIKDFIINIAKTFGFNIEAKNGKLIVDTKKYKETSEPLRVDDNIDIDVSKVNFSRLKIMSGVTDNDILDEYEEKHGEYGAQIINTGYTIKKEEKEVELPYSVPLALTDYNYFAYDQFGTYLNGGYNRCPTGDIRGLDDGLILGYLQTNKDEMYVTDTEISEATEFKPMLSNSKLVYNPSGGGLQWTFEDGDSDKNLTLLKEYLTFMPYRLVNGEVVESLEVNKPLFNFGGLTDANYPADTTLYHRFHRRMLTDKYDANTHILTARMFIDGIQNVYNIYNYKNSNYIISELLEYDPTEPNMYEVKLMRVNNIDNYTSVVELPPETPDLYTNTLQYTVTSTFDGDVRYLGNRLGGHEVQLLTSTNSEPFEVRQDIASLVPNYVYENGKTKIVTTSTYSTLWDASNEYKFKTQQQLRYRPEGSTGLLFDIPDSGVVTLTNTNNTIGATLNDTRNISIPMGETDSTNILTTPITLDNFKKTSVTELGSSYELVVEFELTNGTSELHGYNVKPLNLTALGEPVNNIEYNKHDMAGGVRIIMRFIVPSQLSLVDPLEDIDVKMNADSNNDSINIYSGVNDIKGGFQTIPEAVGGYALFINRDVINISGNTIGGGTTTVKYEGTVITYLNTINRI